MKTLDSVIGSRTVSYTDSRDGPMVEPLPGRNEATPRRQLVVQQRTDIVKCGHCHQLAAEETRDTGKRCAYASRSDVRPSGPICTYV